MSAPDRPPDDEPGEGPATHQRRVTRTALLQPRGLLVLAIGGFFFAASREWWVVPLTLATYASLVYLTVVTPAHQNRAHVEAGETSPPPQRDPGRSRPTPEQRATHLPRGETRQRTEAALESHGRVLVAVEVSDDAARATLSGVAARLHRTADLLLDLAEARESADEELTALRQRGTHPGREPIEESHSSRLTELEEELDATDAELSGAPEKLLAFRTKVVRVSIETGDAATARAAELVESLDAWNLRLHTLVYKLSSPNER